MATGEEVRQEDWHEEAIKCAREARGILQGLQEIPSNRTNLHIAIRVNVGRADALSRLGSLFLRLHEREPALQKTAEYVFPEFDLPVSLKTVMDAKSEPASPPPQQDDKIVGRIWECKIGNANTVPPGADQPMREAVYRAYLSITGKDPEFIFSGWGAELTEGETEVVAAEAKRKLIVQPPTTADIEDEDFEKEEELEDGDDDEED